MMSNAPKASGLSGTSDAARDGGVDLAGPDRPERLADRDGARRARVRGRQDRPVDAERDPEVGRGRAAEHRQGEGRADRPDAALEVALVLLLGEGDPTERAADVDPGAVRVGRLRSRRASSAGVGERLAPG